MATPGLVVYLYPILGTWNFVGSQLLGFLRIWSLPGEDFHDGCCFSKSHLMGHMEFSVIFVISIAIISVGDLGGISKIFGTHSLFSLLLGGKCVVVLSMDSWLQMEMKRICEHNTFKYHIGIPLNVCLYFERRGVLIKSGEKINTVLF